MINFPIPGLDWSRFMAALASVESSGGHNNVPRFEPSYLPKGYRLLVQDREVVGTGRNFNAVVEPRWRQFGPASAASYSPWQILYHTAADLGFPGHPAALWEDRIGRVWVEKRLFQLGQYYLKDSARVHEGDPVAYLADAWNSGNARDGLVPSEYIRRLKAAYNAAGGGA